MKRILTILTAIVMLLTLTACSTTTQGDGNVVGNWQGEIDYAGVVNAFVAENDVLSVSGVTLDRAPITVTYTFLEDGTATCELDQTALDGHLMVLFKDVMSPMMGMLGGTTVEEYIANSGQTDEELLRSLFTDETYGSIVSVLEFSGTYTAANGKLSVTVNGNASQAKISLDGETLTVSSPVGTTTASDLQETAMKTLFPLTLKKVG